MTESGALSLAIGRVTIEDVWVALGGGPLLRNRGRAFWRRGDGWSISLNPQTKTWHDFVTSDGGGILRLIEVATGKSRADAACWLIEHAGIPDSRRPLSIAVLADLSARRGRAEKVADAFLEWRRSLIESLALEAANNWESYRNGSALIRTLGLDHAHLDMGQIADNTEAAEQWAETCDRLRDRLKSMPMRDLVSMWRRSHSERDAA